MGLIVSEVRNRAQIPAEHPLPFKRRLFGPSASVKHVRLEAALEGLATSE